jgi:hypothetical protein
VTWEILDDLDEEAPRESVRVFVDVEAPLRPFGSIPTPPRGSARIQVSPQKGHALPPAAAAFMSGEGDAEISTEGDAL